MVNGNTPKVSAGPLGTLPEALTADPNPFEGGEMPFWLSEELWGKAVVTALAVLRVVHLMSENLIKR